MKGFTTEFGMGSSVSPSLCSPSHKERSLYGYCWSNVFNIFFCSFWVRLINSSCSMNKLTPVRAIMLRERFKSIVLLVPVSSIHYCTYTPGLSTWWSTTTLIGNTSFEVGFTLRCFQRLSRPHIATQRCSWQNNWYTSGAFNSVLSY